MGEYVIIKIREEDGQVTIEDEKGRPLKHVDEQRPGFAVKVGEQVRFLDGAFWYSSSPICVVHAGRRYCSG